ncbi:hypothetical protein ACWFOS_13630 [Gordonia terrae]
MNAASLIEFQRKLDTELPRLPLDRLGDFDTEVESGWVDGVDHQDRESNYTNVSMRRFAANDQGYAVNILEYVVTFQFEIDDCVQMSPVTAIKLGQLLMLAGAHAIGDLAENADFLTKAVKG